MPQEDLKELKIKHALHSGEFIKANLLAIHFGKCSVIDKQKRACELNEAYQRKLE